MKPAEKCRSCGAEVVWATIPTSKRSMPLDAEPVLRIDPDIYGREMVVTDAGEVVRGWVATPSVPPERIVEGRRSHFATCPQADRHRKARRR